MKELIKETLKLLSFKVLAYLFAGSTSLYLANHYIDKDKSDNEYLEKEMEEIASSQDLNKTHQKRSPSSTKKAEHSNRSSTYSPPQAPRISKIDKSNFIPTESKNTVVSNSGSDEDNNNSRVAQENYSGSSSSAASPGLASYTPEAPVMPVEDEALPPTTAKKGGSAEGPTASAGGRAIASKSTTPSVKKAASTDTKTDSTSTGGSSTSSNSPTTNTCTSNVISGAFGNPQGVTISCTYTSQIKYCLAKDVCCDPDTQGTNYTSYIVVGAKDGNYCLSYYGTSTQAGSSSVVQQNYTINSTLPNLTVGNPKTYFQTTELNASSFITSLDFGKENHTVGQINLKSHDPGASGLNYDCSEIVENDLSALTPSPVDLLSIFDVSLAAPSSQIEIPLRPSELSYGENFVTSFIRNNAYVAPLYSCATSVITLDDFDYFQADNSQGVSGDNSVREFEGQFSAYGFFEDNTSVYRGPAGASSEDQSGSSLKSGLFGIFY